MFPLWRKTKLSRELWEPSQTRLVGTSCFSPGIPNRQSKKKLLTAAKNCLHSRNRRHNYFWLKQWYLFFCTLFFSFCSPHCLKKNVLPIIFYFPAGYNSYVQYVTAQLRHSVRFLATGGTIEQRLMTPHAVGSEDSQVCHKRRDVTNISPRLWHFTCQWGGKFHFQITPHNINAYWGLGGGKGAFKGSNVSLKGTMKNNAIQCKTSRP